MFQSLVLYTQELTKLKRFYMNVLQLDITNVTAEKFTVTIGSSSITFKLFDEPAFYHFAINIPGNQFSQMKYWITEKIKLNRDRGRDEIYFPNFDADSMYFYDAGGNIVELIGRRNRDMFGDLTSAAFLNVSEIGIVTPYVAEIGEQLQDLGIPLNGSTEVNPHGINFLGRDDAFIVLVPPERQWFFSDKKAQVFPLEIVLTNGQHLQLDHEGKLHVKNEENS